MSYEFTKSESPRKALARIASELIAKMRLDLLHPDAEGVHDARRCCKMLRAAIRLGRDGLKVTWAENGRRRIRTLAHMLSGSRDATVRLETFCGLSISNSASLEYRLAEEADAEQHRQFSPVAQQKARRAVEAINAAVVGRLNWGDVTWPHVIAGIARSYRRGRKAFREYRKNESEETLHEWRKRAKDLMYHVQLLGVIRRKKMHRLEKRLEEVADSLGLVHDLIVLRAFLQGSNQCDAEQIESLNQQVGERCQEHIAEACHCATRIFEDRPRKFEARLARWAGIDK